ncbi:conserved Plasmodium protein, unknown function [Plasmodium gallinaceum]|uniref:Uncharacterized protein n=1 Tax=Plasmodium gallinaceum TaxID=5849 RepID=A0A1J1GPR8_PLAGA|nr:conserved Plasmodium protein, unknown function [Plasmodium gallinaceum]CRG93010.1 conserved Plasmodium protein, unknown function [Plasmodium gallinaceum]
MCIFFFLNKVLATVGGVLLVFYDLSKIYIPYMQSDYHRSILQDTKYFPSSYFILLSFSYMFLNTLSSTKNYVSNSLRGFLGCFLITYSLFYFLCQSLICYDYSNSELPEFKEAVYFCIFLFLYMCSLIIETFRSLKTKHQINEKESGSIKIEV